MIKIDLMGLWNEAIAELADAPLAGTYRNQEAEAYRLWARKVRDAGHPEIADRIVKQYGLGDMNPRLARAA